jgi:uncharacterized protein
MLGPDSLLHFPMVLVVVAVIVLAALAHGTMGFGFPIISTPIVAMMTDIKTAILVTLFPNIVVNLVSVLRGGNWRQSIGKYWPVALYVLIGTIIGTRALIVFHPEPLKLLLAIMLLVYLRQASFRELDWSWLKRYKRGSALLFGSVAGFLAGTVNVTVPPLIIYFMALGLEPIAMTQTLNLCFLVGKVTQALTLGISGSIGGSTLIASAPLTLVAVVALFLGMRIQRGVQPQAYRKLLNRVLSVMALILVLQVGWYYLSSILP